MKILIIKTGAAGDVLRTSVLLEEFKNDIIHWFTTEKNACLAGGKIITDPKDVHDHYDWVINLEEDPKVFGFVETWCSCEKFTGPYSTPHGLAYQPCPNRWFDMSRISLYGPHEADNRKWGNRRSFQDLLFEMIGRKWKGQKYIVPKYNVTDRKQQGDVGIIISDDTVWPTKNWAHIKEMHQWLKDAGYTTNILQRRDTIEEHIADITGHKLIICGDSLPMHICIAHKIPCVALFTCTASWEIETYGVVSKVVSPKLQTHFYKKGYNEEVASSISKEEVIRVVQERLMHV